MKSIIATILVFYVIITTAYFAMKISSNLDDFIIITKIEESADVISSLFSATFSSIRKFIFDLFYMKNIFGKFIGVIMFISSIPAIIIIIILMSIILACNLAKIIYLLGNKK